MTRQLDLFDTVTNNIYQIKNKAMVSKTFKARVALLLFIMRHPFWFDSVSRTRAAQRTMLRVGEPHQNVNFYQMHWNMSVCGWEVFRLTNLKNFMERESRLTLGGRKCSVESFQVEADTSRPWRGKDLKRKEKEGSCCHLPGKSNRRWKGGRSRWGCRRCRGRWGGRRRWRSRWGWWGGSQRRGRCGCNGGDGGGPSYKVQLRLIPQLPINLCNCLATPVALVFTLWVTRSLGGQRFDN